MKALAAFLLLIAPNAFAQAISPIPAAQLKSGIHFQSQTLRAQQADDAQNPGMLWVDLGKQQFATDCAGCHADARMLAPAFPRAVGAEGESAINISE